jgi:hypothetical protein
MIPNVAIEEADRDRIRNFAQHTDMRQYVHDFLAKRMPAILPKRPVIHPEPQIELPKLTISEPSPSVSQILSVQIVRASSFVEMMDPDPASHLLLDISIAGKRYRTAAVEASTDPDFHEQFSLDLSEWNLEELSAFGLSTITAILMAGPSYCIYGTAFFDWRRCFTGYAGFPVSLQDSRTGDECGVVHIKLQMSPILCTSAELENLVHCAGPRTSHICPISSRLIPTPFHALRFASLFSEATRTFTATGKVKDEEAFLDDQPKFSRGFSIHSVLASRTGNASDICAVLCSLLCGFGFESYVCGTKVLTIHHDRKILWDPFRCERTNVESLPTVSLYGLKCKLDPLVDEPSAEVCDPRIWRLIELEEPISIPSLLPCPDVDELAIETNVKRRICDLRHTRQTRFDEKIELALRPLIHSYEMAKLNEGCDIWSGAVNDSIRKLIPKGSTIRLVPLCVHGCDPKSIFMAVQAKAQSLIHHPGADVFALSLAVFPYAEDLYSSWTLVGAVLSQVK